MAQTLRVLLGVTGSIAAYKSAEVVRSLRERGHEVRCALTESAAAFIGPLTLEVLTGHRVYSDDYLEAAGRGEEEHIAAARWAHVLAVAPATANFIARLALGLADDFLTTTALAFPGPVLVAPAMHPEMWDKGVIQEHVRRLQERRVQIVGPVEGPLASDEVGVGRMVEPAELVAAIETARPAGPLAGRKVLVTAGPTREPLDPVRFLSNRSSGRMGFALAAEAARRGARVVLVAGPVELPTPPWVERIDVTTALEMEEAVTRHAPEADLIIMAAAVADFRPVEAASTKIKKEGGPPRLELAPNPDILTGLQKLAPRALRVGFAAETGDLEANARAKLDRKGADVLVVNDVSRTDIGFEGPFNEVTAYRRNGPPVFLSRRPKGELATALLDLFAETLITHARQGAAAPE